MQVTLMLRLLAALPAVLAFEAEVPIAAESSCGLSLVQLRANKMHKNVADADGGPTDEALIGKTQEGLDAEVEALRQRAIVEAVDASVEGLISQAGQRLHQNNLRTIHKLDFCAATVGQNNLGGAGPDDGASAVIFKNIASIASGAVDLEVSTAGSYVADHPEANGLTPGGCFGQINIQCGKSVDLLFRFTDAASGEAVSMPEFVFSLADLDEGRDGKCQESATVSGHKEYYSSSATELATTAADGSVTFTASTHGDGADNPSGSIEEMTSKQTSRSVALFFESVSEFKISYTTTDNGGQLSRNLLFAGEATVPVLAIREGDWTHSFDQKGWSTVDGAMTGVYRGSSGNKIYALEKTHFVNIELAECYDANWWGSFDRKGWGECSAGHYMAGLYRNDCDDLACIEEAKCCKRAGHSDYFGDCNDANWWGALDGEGWAECPAGKAIVGIYRNDCNELGCLEMARCCPYE